MPSYKAPLEEYRFIMNDVLDAGALSALPSFEDATPDLIASILEEAAKFCETVLLPLNQKGDAEGCTFENGVVRTPAGFKEAYDLYVQARLAGPFLLAAIWRPGPAGYGGLRGPGVGVLGQRVLRHVSRPNTWRL